jgi:hypothetical protein
LEDIKISLLQQLPFNLKFQELCFLLRKKYGLSRTKPLADYWNNRYQYYFEWSLIPQAKSIIEYDLQRICNICGMKVNLANYVLIFTCAQYGTLRTTKWLLNNRIVPDNTIEILTRDTVIKYLHNMLVASGIRIDTYIDLYIEEAFKNDNELYMERPIDEEEIKVFNWVTNHELPLKVADMVDSLDNRRNNPNQRPLRNRELERNYLFYRWKKKGLKLKEIAQKWDSLNREVIEVANEDIVAKGLKAYMAKYGPVEDESLFLYKHYVKHFDQRVAAEKSLEAYLEHKKHTS